MYAVPMRAAFEAVTQGAVERERSGNLAEVLLCGAAKRDLLRRRLSATGDKRERKVVR